MVVPTAYLPGVVEGLLQFPLRQVLSEVDDGVLQHSPAARVIAQPGGSVVKDAESLPGGEGGGERELEF